MDGNDWIRASVQRMQAYVPGEQPAESDLIKLNTNENPYPPAPGVMHAVAALSPDVLRRYPPPTSKPLRACIAALHGVDETAVFCGNGSDEILALCTRAFVEKDREIGFFDPSYSLYPVLAAIAETGTREVKLGDGFSWVTPPLDGEMGLFFLTNPNAPTGLRFPLENIATFCEQFKGVVLIDEAYVDFATENCLSLTQRFPNVIVSRSLSKSYSLAGVRVGYAVGSPALIQALDKIKDSYNLDIVAQRLAVAALQDQSYMLDCVNRIRTTREILHRALVHRGFSLYDSETNFIWCKPPRGLTAEHYVEALRSHGILIRHFGTERLAPYVRISIGLDSQMEYFIETTDEILEGYHG